MGKPPPAGKRAMTVAERQRRYRAKHGDLTLAQANARIQKLKAALARAQAQTHQLEARIRALSRTSRRT